MTRFRHVRLAAALLLLGACAAEVPEEEELPLPPPPPPRLQAVRPAATPPARNGAEAEVAANGAAEPQAVAEPTAREAAEPPLPAPRAWRVVRDGTLGCAEPAPLRLARQGGEVVPRLLAEARAAGGCRTTFRVNEWALEASEADLVRLRLLNGPALTLWFLRADVIAP